MVTTVILNLLLIAAIAANVLAYIRAIKINREAKAAFWEAKEAFDNAGSTFNNAVKWFDDLKKEAQSKEKTE